MNLLSHYIHDCRWSFGRLLFPLFWLKKDITLNRFRWLAYFKDYGFRVTDKYGFHNCTRTGIY